MRKFTKKEIINLKKDLYKKYPYIKPENVMFKYNKKNNTYNVDIKSLRITHSFGINMRTCTDDFYYDENPKSTIMEVKRDLSYMLRMYKIYDKDREPAIQIRHDNRCSKNNINDIIAYMNYEGFILTRRDNTIDGYSVLWFVWHEEVYQLSHIIHHYTNFHGGGRNDLFPILRFNNIDIMNLYKNTAGLLHSEEKVDIKKEVAALITDDMKDIYHTDYSQTIGNHLLCLLMCIGCTRNEIADILDISSTLVTDMLKDMNNAIINSDEYVTTYQILEYVRFKINYNLVRQYKNMVKNIQATGRSRKELDKELPELDNKF